MRELAQRLGALDQDVSETLKVVTYFDTILTRAASVDAFVRGAAVLAGVPAGFVHPLHQISVRIDPSGTTAQAPRTPEHPHWPTHHFDDGSGGVVWLERPEGALLLDAMLLERLAVGIRLTLDRVSPLGIDDAAALELLVLSATTPDAKRKALRRLQLTEDSLIRVAVTRADESSERMGRSAAIDTPLGRARAHIMLDDDHIGGSVRAGVGSRVRGADAHQSWEQAVLAWRLTSRLHPQLRWDQVAALAPTVREVDGGAALIDGETFEHLAQELWTLDTLEALASTDSARQAASALGLHHSTIQARQARLEAALGYRITDYLSRTRILIGLAGYRARHARFTPPND